MYSAIVSGVVKPFESPDKMGCRTKVITTIICCFVMAVLYAGSIGVGLLAIHWWGYNVETGCFSQETALNQNSTRCESGPYKCMISNNYHLFLVCPIYGSIVFVVVIVALLLYCVKKRICASNISYEAYGAY